MIKVYYRFYEELNKYLPEEKHKVWFEVKYEKRISVLNALHIFNIPQKKVDLLLVNQKSKGFDYVLKNNDRISVYPVFELFDITDLTKVREKPLRNIKFVCDVHLGKLCKYLRMLGFDTLYSNQNKPNDIVKISNNDNRIVLSKDYSYNKNKNITHFYWVRSSDSREQLKDLIRKMQLVKSINPFTRCIICNDYIKEIDKNKVKDRLLPNTNKFFNKFYICRTCDKIFWKGSHYEDMVEFINRHFIIKNTNGLS